MKAKVLLLVAAVVGGLSGCSTVPSEPRESKTDDSGYFLSLAQKGQLIGTGQIQDGQGRWYDVWIVPGYVQPARQTKTSLRQTGSDLAEYVHAEKYRDLRRFSGDALEWASDDCLTEFTVKGVPRAWGRYWSDAGHRTQRRVFGWWLAYPWAFLESTADTVVRVPAGLAGTALGTVWGVAVVPGYYAVNSTIKGAWDFSANSVLLPAVACTWNTLAAPPMAIVGQKPAPSRVDGFWVKQLGKDGGPTVSPGETSVTSKDMEALSLWGCSLLTASQPYEERRQVLRKQIQDERAALDRKAQQAEEDIRKGEDEAVRALAAAPSLQETLAYLRSRGLDPVRISQAGGDVRQYLGSQKKLSPAEASRIMLLLNRYPLSSATTNQPALRPKTDPVQRSVEVIKEIQ